MRNLAIFVFFFIQVMLTSCKSSDSRVLEILKDEKFDSAVIADIKIYEKLKEILISNMDTIFQFKSNHDNQKTLSKKYKMKNNLNFTFFHSNDSADFSIDTQNMPLFIFNSVDSIYKKLGPNKIASFYISHRHLIVDITLKELYGDEGKVKIRHSLTYNWHLFHYYEKFTKDTLLNDQWKYHIVCSKK